MEILQGQHWMLKGQGKGWEDKPTLCINASPGN